MLPRFSGDNFGVILGSMSDPGVKLSALDRWLLIIVKVGLSIGVFLPLFIHSSFYFPFVVPKNIAFRMVVEVALAAYVILALRQPQYRPRWTPVMGLVTAFIAVVTLTSLTGIDLSYSWWGNYERMGGVFYLWHLYAFFVIGVGVLRSLREWHSLLVASIFASLIMSLFAFAQRLDIGFLLPSSGGARLTGTIGNATYLAAYLLFHVFFLAYFALRRELQDLRTFATSFAVSVLAGDLFLVGYDLYQRFKVSVLKVNVVPLFNQLSEEWQKGGAKLVGVIVLVNAITLAAWFLRRERYAVRSLLGALLAFELVILYWTQTRGAILGLLAAVILVSIACVVWVRHRVVRPAAAAMLVLAVSLPIFLFLSRTSDWVKSNPTLVRLANISATDITSESRLLTWQASWQGWVENPVRFLIGYGQENYYYVFNAHFPPRIFRDLGSQIWFDRAHNVIFDIGITTGLIGLVAYLAIFVAAGRVLWLHFRRQGDWATSFVLGGALVAYVVQNLFVFDTLNTHIPFFIIIGVIVTLERDMALAWWQRLLAKLPRLVLAEPVRAGVTTGVIVLLVVSLYSFNIRVLQANQEIYQGLRPDASATRRQRVDHLQRAVDMGLSGRNEARQQLATYVVGLTRDPAVPPDELQAYVKQVMTQLRAGVSEEPGNVRNHLYLASVANRLSALDPAYSQEALESLVEAERLSPNRPQIYFERAQAYFATARSEQAIIEMKRGLALAPDVVESHIDMVIAYLVTRQGEAARAELAEIQGRLNYALLMRDYDRLAGVAERMGDYALIVELSQTMIKRLPQERKPYIGMTQAYAWWGKDAEARAVVGQLLTVFPEDTQLKTEVTQFLADLKAGKLRRPTPTE